MTTYLPFWRLMRADQAAFRDGIQSIAKVARLRLAVIAGKAVGTVSRVSGRGGGTALPGVIAERIYPDVVRGLAQQLPHGTMVVIGTNGKTTTSRMLANVLARSGISLVRNESGSNLARGIATALLRVASVSARMPSSKPALGLFEIDEAAFPAVVTQLLPERVVMLNLFRDQLDRYGEVATIARLWQPALASTPRVEAIVNADDPLLVQTVQGTDVKTRYFGIESAKITHAALHHASDVKACPRCGGRITYDGIFLGHLGHFACENCDFRRPPAEVSAQGVELLGVAGSRFALVADGQREMVELPLPGMYNVYNALAAAAAGLSLGVPLSAIASSLALTTPAFGRMERLTVDGREVLLALAKNPTGMNEIIRTALDGEEPLHLLMMLSDNAADGRDVSWIWDADIELLHGRVASVVFSGTRAADMAVRFKYASVNGSSHQSDVIEDTGAALRCSLEKTPRGARVFVIPTYTAMLAVRRALVDGGHARPYWEQ